MEIRATLPHDEYAKMQIEIDKNNIHIQVKAADLSVYMSRSDFVNLFQFYDRFQALEGIYDENSD